MKLYYIEIQAVYSHGVIGIYDTIQAAKDYAEKIANLPIRHYEWKNMGDGHHDFVIQECSLNSEIESIEIHRYNSKRGWDKELNDSFI